MTNAEKRVSPVILVEDIVRLSKDILGGAAALLAVMIFSKERQMSIDEYTRFAKNGYMGDPRTGEPPRFNPRQTI